MLIRDAVATDIETITEIFNSVIDSSNSVYREERVPVSERQAWFDDKELHGYPVVVVEIDGAGHALLPERPDEVFAALLTFFESLSD